MEFRELESLVALVECGGIRRASERLHLTPGAVHRQLRLLETSLGVKLYDKAGRRMILSQAAEVLLPHVRNILAHRHAALTAMEEWKGLKQGTVRIGAGPAISSYLLPELLRLFRRRLPQIDVFVETGRTPQLLNMADQGVLDLILLVDSGLQDGALIREVSWDFETTLVSRLPRVPRRCHLAALQTFPFILFRKESKMGELVERYFAAQDFQPRVIMRFDQAEAIKAMIRAGLGVAMLPYWTVAAECRKGSIFQIRQREHPLMARILLVRRDSRFLPRAASAFLEIARDFSFHRLQLVSKSPRGAGRGG